MGLLDWLRGAKKKQPASLQYAPTQNGFLPFYSEFGDNVYLSDIVVESIRCKANEMKKLKPRHIRTSNDQESVITDSSVARVLRNPNPYMTTADFLERVTILLELNKNVFIYPEYYISKGGEKIYTALYPLTPIDVAIMVDDKDQYFYRMDFNNGTQALFREEEIIHWRKDYGVDQYFGGNQMGNRGLLKALDRYDKLCQSIAKGIEVSCTINGIMRYNSYLSDDKQAAEQEKFKESLRNNESGILFTDMKTEYTHLPHDVKIVDAETLKFFYETIARANGVSVAILNGDYSKEQKEAFYEHALEGEIISLGQAMTKKMFSKNELAFGNEIVMYPNDITFMSMSNKIEALKSGLPAGIFTKNEARELLGYPPVEGGDVMPRGYNEIDNSQKKGVQNDEESNDESN